MLQLIILPVSHWANAPVYVSSHYACALCDHYVLHSDFILCLFPDFFKPNTLGPYLTPGANALVAQVALLSYTGTVTIFATSER